ncbi:MAG: heavy metal translocating P-type ATPase [Eubacteriales bacterium]|nr:heavy metal translocating P-type ATPase [Eubacteriales bacterium]
MTKQQKQLTRIIVAVVLLAVMMILTRFVEVNVIVQALCYLVAYLLVGVDVVWRAVKGIFRGQWLDENFLMTVATIGAFIIGDYAEAVAVMAFYQVGEYFQDKAVGKARKSIGDLVAVQSNTATVIKGGEYVVVDSEEVEIGDMLLVRKGEAIPVDGILADEYAMLDCKALTGESVPVDVSKNAEVLSGSVNVGDAFVMQATKAFEDSTVAKILELVENASDKKAKTEKFISKFARIYTPVVVGLAVLISIIPPIVDGEWKTWVIRGLTFLTVSCPCALVISIPLTFFAGIGACSSCGVLVKGSNVLESLDKVQVVVCDKTGTLTTGEFGVTAVEPNEQAEQILAIAGQIESVSNHAIARAITKASGQKSCEWQVQEIAGKGMLANKDGQTAVVGKLTLLAEQGVTQLPQEENAGEIFVALDGKFLGKIVVKDTIKSNAKQFVDDMHAYRIPVVMLTGDSGYSAGQVASAVGVDDYRYSLLPAQKVEEMEKIAQDGKIVAFVGDGINDAPSLMRADVGIAMGGIGSDSAIESSDVVLVHDDLSAIVKAKKIARKVAAIAKQNIVFALAVKVLALILSALGLVGMWIAVIADVGVALVAIANAMRAGRVGVKPLRDVK